MVPVWALYFNGFFSSRIPLFTAVYENFRKLFSEIIYGTFYIREAVWNNHQEIPPYTVGYVKKIVFHRIVIDYFHNTWYPFSRTCYENVSEVQAAFLSAYPRNFTVPCIANPRKEKKSEKEESKAALQRDQAEKPGSQCGQEPL